MVMLTGTALSVVAGLVPLCVDQSGILLQLGIVIVDSVEWCLVLTLIGPETIVSSINYHSLIPGTSSSIMGTSSGLVVTVLAICVLSVFQASSLEVIWVVLMAVFHQWLSEESTESSGNAIVTASTLLLVGFIIIEALIVSGLEGCILVSYADREPDSLR